MKKLLKIFIAIIVILFLSFFIYIFIFSKFGVFLDLDKKEYFFNEDISLRLVNNSFSSFLYSTDACGDDNNTLYEKWNGKEWVSEETRPSISCFRLGLTVFPFTFHKLYFSNRRIPEPGVYRIKFSRVGVSDSFTVKENAEPFVFIDDTNDNLAQDEKEMENINNLQQALKNYHQEHFNYPAKLDDLTSLEFIPEIGFKFPYSLTEDKQAFCLKGLLKTKKYGSMMSRDDGNDPYLFENGKGCDVSKYIPIKERYCSVDISDQDLMKIGFESIDNFVSDIKTKEGVKNVLLKDVCDPAKSTTKCRPVIDMKIQFGNLTVYGKTEAVEELKIRFNKMIDELNKKPEFSEKAETYIILPNNKDNNAELAATLFLKIQYAKEDEAKKTREMVGEYYFDILRQMETKYETTFGQGLNIDMYDLFPSIRIVFEMPTAEKTLEYIKNTWKYDLTSVVETCKI